MVMVPNHISKILHGVRSPDMEHDVIAKVEDIIDEESSIVRKWIIVVRFEPNQVFKFHNWGSSVLSFEVVEDIDCSIELQDWLGYGDHAAQPPQKQDFTRSSYLGF